MDSPATAPNGIVKGVDDNVLNTATDQKHDSTFGVEPESTSSFRCGARRLAATSTLAYNYFHIYVGELIDGRASRSGDPPRSTALHTASNDLRLRAKSKVRVNVSQSDIAFQNGVVNDIFLPRSPQPDTDYTAWRAFGIVTYGF